MSPGESRDEKGGVAESLRTAIERTLSATADTAAETRGRAQQVLDEVARRGSAGMRVASARELRAVEERLAGLEARLEALEIAARTVSHSKPKG